MDPSAATGALQSWNEEIDRLIMEYKACMAYHQKILETRKQELREANEQNLERLRVTTPADLYENAVLRMAEKALEQDLQRIELNHQKDTEMIEKIHKKELAQKKSDLHAKLEGMAKSAQLPTVAPIVLPKVPETLNDTVDEGPQKQDVSAGSISWNTAPPNPNPLPKLTKPLTCTIQQEVICGERRLIMRIQSRKHGASPPPEQAPKRLRLDTSVASLPTPTSPLQTETQEEIQAATSQPPERTITFEQVFQGGHAKHKDMIVEWPEGSRRWYILKCEMHGLRFTRHPVQGAAKHLSGLYHGFPDRNRDMAVRTLGYQVIDCNASLAKMNNKAAVEAYDNGYKPPPWKHLKRPLKKAYSRRQFKSQKSTKLPTPNTNSRPTPGATPTRKITAAEKHELLEAPSSERKSSEPWHGITHPKTFHIYYGKWGADIHHKKSEQLYPVLILGWDDQAGSGLKNTDLNHTGLLKEDSKPPNCYKYGVNKIIGWAAGYEDGGSKVKLRKFPVMFFDESQTVGWIAARDLQEFPLYKSKVSYPPDHPFNAARRWIAEREGFKGWEDRERARINDLTLRRPSPSPLTPINESINAKFPVTQEVISANAKSHPPGDSNDLDNSGSEVESIATTETEMLLNEWREKGGEIPGDEDYRTSESDIDETLECELEDWTKISLATLESGSPGNRPWAFYGLRSTESSKDPKSPANPAGKTDENLARSTTAGMDSVRSLDSQLASVGTYKSVIKLPVPQESSSSNAAKSNEDHLPSQPEPRHTGPASKGDHSPKKSPVPTTPPVCQVSDSKKLMPENIADKQRVHESLPGETEKEKDKQNKDLGVKFQEPNQGLSSGAETAASLIQAPTAKVSHRPPPLASTTDAENTLAKVNFGLSVYVDKNVSWKRHEEEEDCVDLFFSVDGKTIATRQGPVGVFIDPMEIKSFSREFLPGSNGNKTLILWKKDGSMCRLVFDRRKGTTLEIGKIQSRNFTRWLRNINTSVECLT